MKTFKHASHRYCYIVHSPRALSPQLQGHPSVCSSLSCHNTLFTLDPSNTKICHFYNLVFIYKQICSFQISMDYIVLMQIFHSFANINCKSQ
nr:hypothetical protein Iba_chr11dCG13120 [Ipomoea batatas]